MICGSILLARNSRRAHRSNNTISQSYFVRIQLWYSEYLDGKQKTYWNFGQTAVTSATNLRMTGGTQYLGSRRDMMILRLTYQRCPPRKSTGRQSPVRHASCQTLCLRVNHLTLDTMTGHTDMYSERYKLTIKRFDVRS